MSAIGSITGSPNASSLLITATKSVTGVISGSPAASTLLIEDFSSTGVISGSPKASSVIILDNTYEAPCALHEELLKLLRHTSNPLSDFRRNEHLERFHDYVGDNVFLVRVPDGVDPKHACVLTPIAIDRDYYCNGESDLVFSTIQIDLYSEDWDAAQRVRLLHDNLRLALSSYIGKIGAIPVKNAEITREALTYKKNLGAVEFELRYSADWVFAYNQLCAS